jgi:hypothetical protein
MLHVTAIKFRQGKYVHRNYVARRNWEENVKVDHIERLYSKGGCDCSGLGFSHVEAPGPNQDD